MNWGFGPISGIFRAVERVLDRAAAGALGGLATRRSTSTSAALGVGGPGTTSSRTRPAVRYLFATRLTSSGVTANSFFMSVGVGHRVAELDVVGVQEIGQPRRRLQAEDQRRLSLFWALTTSFSVGPRS